MTRCMCLSGAQDLVFALLISGDRLISLVRIRSHYLHPTDYHIVCNIVSSTESFKTVEGWIPICLPKFDARSVCDNARGSFARANAHCTLYTSEVRQHIFYQNKLNIPYFKSETGTFKRHGAYHNKNGCVDNTTKSIALLHQIFDKI